MKIYEGENIVLYNLTSLNISVLLHIDYLSLRTLTWENIVSENTSNIPIQKISQKLATEKPDVDPRRVAVLNRPCKTTQDSANIARGYCQIECGDTCFADRPLCNGCPNQKDGEDRKRLAENRKNETKK